MRADVYLSSGGYAGSRQKAKILIESGNVKIDGATVVKASFEVSDGEHTVEIINTEKYVGRGGYKLEAALDNFGVDVSGMSAIDVGASTGGFTDCLLCRGARSVCAVDSGRDQLAAKLLTDARVRSVEGFNARGLDCDFIGRGYDIAVMDVSFISQTYIIPQLSKVVKGGGLFISLIKPQFEAGREALGKNGIVKDRKYHILAIKKVKESAEENGFSLRGLMPSPIKGGDGNTEYLALFENTESAGVSDADELISETVKKT